MAGADRRQRGVGIVYILGYIFGPSTRNWRACSTAGHRQTQWFAPDRSRVLVSGACGTLVPPSGPCRTSQHNSRHLCLYDRTSGLIRLDCGRAGCGCQTLHGAALRHEPVCGRSTHPSEEPNASSDLPSVGCPGAIELATGLPAADCGCSCAPAGRARHSHRLIIQNVRLLQAYTYRASHT